MELAIRSAEEAITGLLELAALTLAHEEAVKAADELVQAALALGASPTDIEGYPRLQELKAKMADRSFKFDGVNDYVQIAHAPELNPSSITIEAWIKPEAFSLAAGIVSKYHSSGVPSYSFGLSEETGKTGHIEFTVNDNPWQSSTKPHTLVSGSAVPLNEWTRVAAVFNADGGKLAIYINGELSGEKSGAVMAKNNSPVNIGRDFSQRYFKGSIDEVRIWETPRTAAEIEHAMTAELSGNEEGLVGFWNFNQSTGINTAGNAHHGEIVGAAPQLND